MEGRLMNITTDDAIIRHFNRGEKKKERMDHRTEQLILHDRILNRHIFQMSTYCSFAHKTQRLTVHICNILLVILSLLLRTCFHGVHLLDCQLLSTIHNGRESK